jgi:AcrR family transcriptional regulator
MGEELRRRSQERGRSTRARLVEAALASLIESGYAATTTIEVARRAGVSRGAQLHHFPTRAELVTAAVDALLTRRVQEFRKAFSNVPPGADRIEAAIDLLWAKFNGPTFAAWAELWIAARTDADLRAVVVEMDRRFTEEVRNLVTELFPLDGGNGPGIDEVALGFALALVDGLALRELVPNTHTFDPAVSIAALKAVAQMTVAQPPEETQ